MAEKGSAIGGAAAAQAEPLRFGAARSATGIRCDRILLGMPVRLICGSVAERQGVQVASAGWHGERDPTAAALTIELCSRAMPRESGHLEFDVSGSRMTLRGSGVYGVASPAERMAQCVLSPDWFARPADLLALVLEPLALFLATRNRRTPIHASAIQVGDLAILFAGPSGAGKSSLALAAHRAGLTVLSEDTVYIRSEPAFAIWGWDGPVHLLPGNACPQTAPLRMRNGRMKHAIAFKNAPSQAALAKSAVVCILTSGARPTLTRLMPQSALDLLHPLEPGFDLLAPDIHAVHRQLCARGAWLLGLSKSPDDAIALVLTNLARLEAGNEQRGPGN